MFSSIRLIFLLFDPLVPQSPRALEELRDAMDKHELETFLTIHIREGAWQVVLLFMDELPEYKLPLDWYHEVWDEDEDEDEEMFGTPFYSSKSGILMAWPTKYDPDLITLCKAITSRDWKVTRLFFSTSPISDEGLKNLSTAVTQSELYSLALYDIGLQSQGLEHLCEALISGDCHLTSINVGENFLGDEGIIHLCNALTSVSCTLTSLDVSQNRSGDEGKIRLCNALTNVNCTLTSLNVSDNMLGDEGIVHLCNALTSVHCKLTSLNVSDNTLGDEGIMHLCNALTSVNCTLTSLNVSRSKLKREIYLLLLRHSIFNSSFQLNLMYMRKKCTGLETLLLFLDRACNSQQIEARYSQSEKGKENRARLSSKKNCVKLIQPFL